mmetsp:Transcript_41852/g.48193  ORF Transcript_41852/g.48193 Transcript_41852/m.48193 type:complete len:356 (+) Transcript_41852:85-1152(+)
MTEASCDDKFDYQVYGGHEAYLVLAIINLFVLSFNTYLLYKTWAIQTEYPRKRLYLVYGLTLLAIIFRDIYLWQPQLNYSWELSNALDAATLMMWIVLINTLNIFWIQSLSNLPVPYCVITNTECSGNDTGRHSRTCQPRLRNVKRQHYYVGGMCTILAIGIVGLCVAKFPAQRINDINRTYDLRIDSFVFILNGLIMALVGSALIRKLRILKSMMIYNIEQLGRTQLIVLLLSSCLICRGMYDIMQTSLINDALCRLMISSSVNHTYGWCAVEIGFYSLFEIIPLLIILSLIRPQGARHVRSEFCPDGFGTSYVNYHSFLDDDSPSLMIKSVGEVSESVGSQTMLMKKYSVITA